MSTRSSTASSVTDPATFDIAIAVATLSGAHRQLVPALHAVQIDPAAFLDAGD